MNATAAARLGMGGNNPPEDTPFGQSKQEIDDLYGEVSLWMDGNGIKSQGDADGVSKLIDMLRKAIATADERRKAEAKPYDEAKLEIQSRYGELIADNKSQKGKAVLALEVCKLVLTPWLEKQEAMNRAVAFNAWVKADQTRHNAQEAMRAAKFDDLESREKAEALLQEAERAEADANRASKDKAHAHGGTKAIGLRTIHRAEITDPVVFARYCWEHHKTEMLMFLLTLAQRMTDGKLRNVPGVTVHQEKRV